jgi:XTP/dITP diphosphohydrolase
MPPVPSRAIVIATHNSHKVREIRRVLAGLPVPLVGLDMFPAYSVRETGRTLEANALLKARAAVRRTGRAALSDDTGLEVAALGGAPGVYSARYAGPGCSFEDNCRKLLRHLRGVPNARRRAVFRCVVALALPDGREKLFEGRCPGKIVQQARGRRGFGYDPVFQPRGETRTFAEMTLKEKNRVSHRARAFLKAARYLRRHHRSLFRARP